MHILAYNIGLLVHSGLGWAETHQGVLCYSTPVMSGFAAPQGKEHNAKYLLQ